MEELNPDVLEKILIGFDVKDLSQCKCVCKSWHSFISSNRFIKAHLNHSYNDDRNNNKIGHRRIMMGDLPVFFKDDCFLVGSSNGLVCISTLAGEMLVANPSTRELKKLRKPKLPDIRFLCWGFGYDSSIDDYKVILGFTKGKDRTRFKVLTLKSNVWKVIGDVNYRCITSAGILCNGALHWVMLDVSPENEKEVILSFHLSEEEFKEIPHPDGVLYHYSIGCPRNINLGIMEECLCIYTHQWPRPDLWIMKKYNVKQSWGMVGHDCHIKYEVVHCLREVKHANNSYEKSLCHKICLYRTWEFLSDPIFVQSLVSPHVQKRRVRKRRSMNTKSGKLIKRDPSIPGSRARVQYC